MYLVTNMKQSLKDRALAFIKAKKTWVPGIQMEALALEAGYKPSNISRRLRELVEEHSLEVQYVRGAAQYRFKEKQTAEQWFDNLPEKR